MSEHESDYLTVPQVAALLAVSSKTIRSEIERGRLPALRIGRLYRVHASDLAALQAPVTYGRRDDEPARRRTPRPVVGEFSRLARTL